MSLLTKRIHILGLGNLGCFFAHCLRKADRVTPISLLFHRNGLFEHWDTAKRKISLETSSEVISDSYYQSNSSHSLYSSLPTSRPIVSGSSAYTIESVPLEGPLPISDSINQSDNNAPIYNLILATKSYKALEALNSIKHRLSKQSTILFVQNGLGIIPKINTELFSDASTRPSYLAALVSHGLYSTGPFNVVHAGLGRVVFGHISEPSSVTSSLVERISDTLQLNATYFDRNELYNFQLEKLVVNAVINPLTALFDCKNGQLFWIGTERILVKKLMKRLIGEINQVFLQLDAPEGPVDPDRFSIENMELMVTGIAKKTRNNLSSMLQDVMNQRETEIEAINGWIVTEGEKKGIDVPCNRKLMELVKREEKINEHLIESHFPGTISSEDLKAWNSALDDLRRNGVKSSKKFAYSQHGNCVQAW